MAIRILLFGDNAHAPIANEPKFLKYPRYIYINENSMGGQLP